MAVRNIVTARSCSFLIKVRRVTKQRYSEVLWCCGEVLEAPALSVTLHHVYIHSKTAD